MSFSEDDGFHRVPVEGEGRESGSSGSSSSYEGWEVCEGGMGGPPITNVDVLAGDLSEKMETEAQVPSTVPSSPALEIETALPASTATLPKKRREGGNR